MDDRIDKLMKFHQADPADTFATYGIAMEHAKAGRGDEALAWLDKTLALDGTYAYAWYHKARLLADAGRVDEARTAIDSGLAAARTSNDAHAAAELDALADSLD